VEGQRGRFHPSQVPLAAPAVIQGIAVEDLFPKSSAGRAEPVVPARDGGGAGREQDVAGGLTFTRKLNVLFSDRLIDPSKPGGVEVNSRKAALR
jgi:hypothetical protein